MGNWNQILKSHVVKMAKNITHNWWGTDVHFYDKFGNYKKNGLSSRNHLCSLMQANVKSARDCLHFRKENLKEINTCPSQKSISVDFIDTIFSFVN